MFSLKYRPFDIDQIAGHPLIKRDIKNRSLDKNFPQVMIFTGETGRGKTTVANIVAGLINCKNPIRKRDKSYRPCGTCESCKSILSKKYDRDVYFYDCSTVGKEDVIRISENASRGPLFDNKKVIILDEAQNLASTAAKGATLTMLEKPREYSYFILCTMEPSKLHKAILDRGQLYKFNDVPFEDIANYMINIIDEEGLIEEVPEEFLGEGLLTISEHSSGCVRNAVQYLEKCLKGKIFSNDDLIKEMGLMSEKSFNDIIEGLIKKDEKIIKEIITHKDIKEFFYKTRKIFVDLLVYLMSGYVDAEWKKTNYNKYKSKSDSVHQICHIYNKINSWQFEKTNFIYEICNYLKE